MIPDFYTNFMGTNQEYPWVFLIGYAGMSVALYCQVVMLLQVGRESLAIWYDEHKTQNLSKTLDRKNLGVGEPSGIRRNLAQESKI